MKILAISAVALAAGLLIAAPSYAQTTPPKVDQSAQKQKTDGDSPTVVGPGSGAYKQRTEGEGPSDGGFNTGPGSKATPK